MKYCFHCNHVTVGEPLFCDHCGRTYDVKLCPRLHMNPRAAEVCSQCGTRDLSTPQPKVPLWARLVLPFTVGLVGAFAGLVSLVFILSVFQELIQRQEMQTGLVFFGILILVMWWSWAQLPKSIRELVYRWLKRKRGTRTD
jgi:hypothetical protein